ncbi:hypothetical protein A7982_12522 [Minicystis rosea]|nr:hypothetical protein A7982_12522 [Minicystis rosea]
MRLGVSVVAALFCSGCATFVTVDGYKVYEGEWNRAKAEISRRAAFDLKCDAGAVQLSVLKASCHGLTTTVCNPEQVGVQGCGRQAVYVNLRTTGWVMNNAAGN